MSGPLRSDPPTPAPSALQRLEEICMSFEKEWKAGGRPPLARYAARAAEADRPVAMRELLGIELECRQALGEVPTEEEYRARFPLCAEAVAAAFARENRGASAPLPAAPVADLPPELANHPKFRIVRELGRGGMGVVYLAEHKEMKQLRAVKVINKELLERPGVLARFKEEIHNAARLVHSNIVIAHDAERVGGLHLLVMEYVEGESLAQVLESRGPLSVLRACNCVCQAANGLQHAFEQSMVHRDIKPHNLMLTPRGRVKILDFGLARVVSEHSSVSHRTPSDALMGTPAYIAPEQAQDARTADIRADIYSLGCTLYCLLAGHPPFQEKTLMEVLMAHMYQEPKPLRELRPDVPEEVAVAVARMMAKQPAHRFQTPAEVVRALTPFGKLGRREEDPAPVAAPHRATSSDTGTVSLANTNAGAPGDPRTASVVREQASSRSAGTQARRFYRQGGIAAAIAAGLVFLVVGALCLGILNNTNSFTETKRAPGVIPNEDGPGGNGKAKQGGGGKEEDKTTDTGKGKENVTDNGNGQDKAAGASKGQDKVAEIDKEKKKDAVPGKEEDNAAKDARLKRLMRWTMDFNTTDGNDYAQQLDGLGAILAVPDPEKKGEYLVIRDLKARPVKPVPEDVALLHQIFWRDKDARSIVSLASALGLRRMPTEIVAFFPTELEAKLLDMELKAANKPEEEIRETKFGVRHVGGKYVPVVISQR